MLLSNNFGTPETILQHRTGRRPELFGKGRGQRQTRETLTQWQDKLIAFVEQNG